MTIQELSHTFFYCGLIYSTFLSIVLTIRGISRWLRPTRAAAKYTPLPQPTSAEEYGDLGERIVEDALRDAGIPTLRNVFLHEPGGQMTEIDLLALVGRTILVIEVKAWAGEIIGRADDKEWIQRKGSGALKRMKSPLLQNRHHLRALRTAVPKAEAAGIVVFTDSIFPEGRPAGVVNVSALVQMVETSRSLEPSPATVLAWGKLSAWSMRQDKEELREALVAQIERRMSSVQPTEILAGEASA